MKALKGLLEPPEAPAERSPVRPVPVLETPVDPGIAE